MSARQPPMGHHGAVHQLVQHGVTLPHSDEAEQSVLGALLLDCAAWDRAAELLSTADFYQLQHKVIFDAIAKLVTACKPADPITVHEALHREGKLTESGGLAYLNALAQAVPSAANLRRYAEIVRELSLRRSLVLLGARMADAALARGEGAEGVLPIVDRHAEELLALGQVGTAAKEPGHVDAALVRFLDQLNAAAEGHDPAIATGLRVIDRKTAGGGRPGELWVVGARPSMGKSALMLTLWINVAKAGHGALFLTMEDSDTTLVSRALANRGRINLADLRNPSHCQTPDAMWSGVAEGVEELRGLPMLMDDQGGLTLADVRRKVQQAKRTLRGGLKLVIVDYLQLMTGDGDNRNQQLGAVANGMKALAKEMGVWIVLLSQLSRKADERSGVPQLSDLRDSGDIEGAGDTILLLHREAHRNQTLGPEWKHFAEAHIAKQKNGPTCIVPLHFDGAFQRFADWEGERPHKAMGRGHVASDGGFD